MDYIPGLYGKGAGVMRQPKGLTLRQAVKKTLQKASQQKELEKLKNEVAGMEAELHDLQSR